MLIFNLQILPNTGFWEFPHHLQSQNHPNAKIAGANNTRLSMVYNLLVIFKQTFELNSQKMSSCHNPVVNYMIIKRFFWLKYKVQAVFVPKKLPTISLK
jgi:hypothetical protein